MMGAVKKLKYAAAKTGWLIGLMMVITLLTACSLFYGWLPEVTTDECPELKGSININVQVLSYGRLHSYTVTCPAGTIVKTN